MFLKKISNSVMKALTVKGAFPHEDGVFLASFEQALPITAMPLDDFKPARNVVLRIAKVTSVLKLKPNPFEVIFKQRFPVVILVKQSPAGSRSHCEKRAKITR